MTRHLQLSFELGGLEADRAEAMALACGAIAVTFVDARDDPVLEPALGEVRLWRTTRMLCLFELPADVAGLQRTLAAALSIDPASIGTSVVAERIWEREWLKDFHALRFGRRLWVCPHHERVEEPDAAVVMLDPGLAFGTGTHPTTALCLEWLDRYLDRYLDLYLQNSAAPADDLQATAREAHLRVIDYGCGSGVLALAAVKLGAQEAHCFDIDPQALIATAANAEANGIASQVHVHDSANTLPAVADLLLANILAGPLCALAPRFASLVRPGGALVLAGLMAHEVSEVTEAYAAWFDVAGFGERGGWMGLAGRRR
ncbi:MAG: 50S ribosomal protein L11 methyltransferase [Gammaproteobacteria bacterium]|nr:50S ribosomal protein L11 methyltransferase [Gammaproteobacteria bacterium]